MVEIHAIELHGGMQNFEFIYVPSPDGIKLPLVNPHENTSKSDH